MREKDRILLARLRLPPLAYSRPEIPELVSPANGFRPMGVGMGAACEPNGICFGRLSWSPFIKESVGQNSLEGNELVLLDTVVGCSEGSPSVFLDRLDLIRILSLNTQQSRIHDERRLSWKLRIGLDRFRKNSGNHFDGVFSFGAGRAWKWTHHLTAFGLVNGEMHADSTLLRAFPESGLIIALSGVRAKVGFGMVSSDYSGGFSSRFEFKVMVRLNERQSVHLEHRDDQSSLTAIGLSRYF